MDNIKCHVKFSLRFRAYCHCQTDLNGEQGYALGTRYISLDKALVTTVQI